MSVTKKKRCTRCLVMKPATREHFIARGDRSGGLHPWCRDCKRAYSREASRLSRERRLSLR